MNIEKTQGEEEKEKHARSAHRFLFFLPFLFLCPLFPPFILFLCFSLAGLIRAKNKEENKGKEEAQRSDIYLQFIFLFNRKMKKIIKL